MEELQLIGVGVVEPKREADCIAKLQLEALAVFKPSINGGVLGNSRDKGGGVVEPF